MELFPGPFGNVQADQESTETVADGDLVKYVGSSGRKTDTSGIKSAQFTALQRIDTGEFEDLRLSSGAIKSVAEVEHPEPEEGEDPLPDQCLVTCWQEHQLEVGETVTISGTTDYDGDYEVIEVDETGTKFVIEETFTETKTGAWACAKAYVAPFPFNLFDPDMRVQKFVGASDADVELITGTAYAPFACFGTVDGAGAADADIEVESGDLSLVIDSESAVGFDIVVIYKGQEVTE